eukprot:GFKZ01012846.1.p3 GENE.GFKZ01012846.1~~GFKZ01012846.1.p3  ORF type:complete len:127 (-),score=13.72 GFKZ01012846.1:2-382(-)
MHTLATTMMNTHDMSPAMALLFKPHATNMGTSDSRRMRACRTHAFCTFKRALIKMNHANMTVETVAKGEGAMTGGAAMVSLFEVCDAEMFVCVASFGKGFVTDFAREGFRTVGCANVEREIGGGGG